MLPLRENDIPAQHPFTMAVASSRIHVMPSLMVYVSVWLLIIRCPHDTMTLQSIVQEDPLEGVSSAREKECCPGWPSSQKKHQICLSFSSISQSPPSLRQCRVPHSDLSTVSRSHFNKGNCGPSAEQTHTFGVHIQGRCISASYSGSQLGTMLA